MLASRFAQSCVHSAPLTAPAQPSSSSSSASASASASASSTLVLPDGQALAIRITPSGGNNSNNSSDITITSSQDGELYTLTLQHPAPEFTSPTEEPDDNSLHARSLRAPHITALGPADRLAAEATEADLWTIAYAIYAQPVWAAQELIVLTPQAIQQAGLAGLRPRILTSGMGVEQPAPQPPSGSEQPQPEPQQGPKAILLTRAAFWQGAGQGALEGTSFAPWVLPAPLQSAHTRSHTPALLPHLSPARSPLPKPAYKTEGPLYVRYIPHLSQTLSFRLIDPQDDGDVRRFATWQDSDRVHAGWRQRASGGIDEHRAYLAKGHASPDSLGLVGYWDDEPWGYIEIYWAKESNIAPFYDVRDFDRGFHALVGEDKFRGEHRVRAWMSSVLHLIFLLDPRTDRAVSEPRASNAKMVNYECLNGGHVEKLIDLGHKRAALVLFPRERFFQLCPLAWSPPPSSSGTASKPSQN
ncbi:hypothetical protein OC842_004856 [Tilletia horrida]|uniref:Acyltransferase MbtK/IucB-like conserved domain-containing protein n=1 Tax=Tilletia horrida TaxID=155126 RepID=A0AAN6GDF1_9BASI|nr:hypothetical protein OC842_004856 [Tilletia horrida]